MIMVAPKYLASKCYVVCLLTLVSCLRYSTQENAVQNNPLLLYYTRSNIRLTNVSDIYENKTKSVILLKNYEIIIDVDYHFEQKKLFWADDSFRAIFSSDIDGTTTKNEKEIISQINNSPRSLTCDWVANNLYWINIAYSRIEVATIEGHHRKALYWLKNDGPMALAIAPKKGYIFWTASFNPEKIERAWMNGDENSKQILISKNLKSPTSLTVDEKSEYVYWLDSVLGYIKRMDYDGKNIKTILNKDLHEPVSLRLFGTKLFWTENTNIWAIYYYDLETQSKPSRWLLDENPMDFLIWDPGRQPNMSHPCQTNNGGCSHLCLISPEPSGYNCSCPNGFKIINNKSCIEEPEELLLFVVRSEIRLVYKDMYTYNSYQLISLPENSDDDTVAIDYDPMEGYIYWSEPSERKIFKAMLNGTDQQEVLSTDILKPDGIALDWLSKNLYWIEGGKNRIEVIQLTAGYRKVIIKDKLAGPKGIAVAPELGWVFWTDLYGKIERSNLDGSKRFEIVNNGTGWPYSIALDIKNRKIYWSDPNLNKIESVKMDGTRRTELVIKRIDHPYCLTLMDDYLYWSNQNIRIIRAQKENGQDATEIYGYKQIKSLKAIRLGSVKGWNPCKENNGNCSHFCFYRHNKIKICSCQNDYELASDNHTCITSIGCILPQDPLNGRWSFLSLNHTVVIKPNNLVDIGTTLQYECWLGYNLDEENNNITCLNTGWDKKPPKCEKICPTIYPYEYSKVSCYNSYNVEINCSEAISGSYANFECEPYYETSDLEIRLCEDGLWNLNPLQCYPVCGEERVSVELLAVNGTKVKRGNYPWIAALYERDDDNFIFLCGGTMLTQKIILTAAHCVTNIYGDPYSSDQFKIAVGKYFRKYGDSRDTEAQYSDIEELLVHPKYKADSQREASDMALLITKDKLAFSKFVQPVCYRNLKTINLSPNELGIVAGWGHTTASGNSSDTLQELTVPYKDDATCARELTSDWARRYLTYDKFCAGYYNRSTAVCHGDSGSGLVFKHKDRYYVHGIVSLTKTSNDGCDIEVSALYTKVSVHYEWLELMVFNYTFQSIEQ